MLWGVVPKGQLGERHESESHLIPLAIRAASVRRPHISVFGRNYETPEGTFIKDYVHIIDLWKARWLTLQSLIIGGPSPA